MSLSRAEDAYRTIRFLAVVVQIWVMICAIVMETEGLSQFWNIEESGLYDGAYLFSNL